MALLLTEKNMKTTNISGDTTTVAPPSINHLYAQVVALPHPLRDDVQTCLTAMYTRGELEEERAHFHAAVIRMACLARTNGKVIAFLADSLNELPVDDDLKSIVLALVSVVYTAIPGLGLALDRGQPVENN